MENNINLQTGKPVCVETSAKKLEGKFIGFVNMGNIAFFAVMVHKQINLIPLHLITAIDFEHSEIQIIQPKIQL